MGGVGSGRPPSAESIINKSRSEQMKPMGENDVLHNLPNYSGVQRAALRIAPALSAGGGGNSFETIAVSGQSSVVAESSTDTLNLIAGSNMTITTDASTDSVTFASSGSGGTWGTITGTLSNQTDLQTALNAKANSLGSDDNYVTDAQLVVIGNTSGTNTGDQLVFKTVTVSGQNSVVADGITDTLTLVAGTGITLNGNATDDSIIITSSVTGNVTKVGTPSDDQVGVWTGDGTIEGTSGLTYSGTILTVSATANPVIKLTDTTAAKTWNVNVGTSASLFNFTSPNGANIIQFNNDSAGATIFNSNMKSSYSGATPFTVSNHNGTSVAYVNNSGQTFLKGLPTSAAGLASGALWVDLTGGLNYIKWVV